MSYQSIPLLAGKPYRLDSPGVLLLIDSPGIAGGIDVQLVRGGQALAVMPNRKAAFRHVGAFDGVILTAEVDTTAGFFISFDDVNLGLSDSSAVSIPQGVSITNPPGAPIPVTFSQQIVPLGSVKINNADAEAVPVVQKVGGSFIVEQKAAASFTVEQKAAAVFTTQAEKLTNIVDHTPAVIGTGAATLLISDATYKRLRVRNASATARVALGGAALTMANAAIILEPGDTWVEDDAAGAAWYAISDTAATDVRVLGIK